MRNLPVPVQHTISTMITADYITQKNISSTWNIEHVFTANVTSATTYIISFTEKGDFTTEDGNSTYNATTAEPLDCMYTHHFENYAETHDFILIFILPEWSFLFY